MELVDTVQDTFKDKWGDQAGKLTAEQQDKIGYAFFKHILGIDDQKIIEKFMARDEQIRHAIGLRQHGCCYRKDDMKSFWEEVGSITDDYSPIEKAVLISREEYDDVRLMIILIKDRCPTVAPDGRYSSILAGIEAVECYFRR